MKRTALLLAAVLTGACASDTHNDAGGSLPVAGSGSATASASGHGHGSIQVLAASCTGCHSSPITTGDSGTTSSAFPALYGRSAAVLERLMLAYRSGKREGTLMPRLMPGYSPQEIAALADYFASTRTAP